MVHPVKSGNFIFTRYATDSARLPYTHTTHVRRAADFRGVKFLPKKKKNEMLQNDFFLHEQRYFLKDINNTSYIIEKLLATKPNEDFLIFQI